MKLSKKKVFALALAVCLIATVSMGTLAWFTDEDEVTNNFYVGDSGIGGGDDTFGVDVWEKVDTNRDSTLEVIGKGDTTENSAKFETILPGETLVKEPYLTNTGIYSQFARAIVTVSNATILKAAMGADWDKANLFLTGTDAAKWTLDNIIYTNDDKLVYIYYYNEVLLPDAQTAPVFTGVAIPGGLTVEQAENLKNFDVNVLGQVIQSEHLADPDVPGTTITGAKKAFTLYYDAQGTLAGVDLTNIKATAKTI